MRGDTISIEPGVEPRDGSESEENGVSGRDVGVDKNSSPRPLGWRTTNSDIEMAGDGGEGVGNVGDTMTGGERERACAS